jgi:uncharacterized membrane protein
LGRNRLEAFSDGVMAIIITIMVLELKIPHGSGLSDLQPLIPVFFSYVLSFVFVGIYWSNHHHLLHTIHKVNGSILWANMHLLFWLSLIPFVTGWMGENQFQKIPVALYGVVMLMAGLAYFILSRVLVAHHGKESVLAKAVGSDFKGKISVAGYAASVPLAFVWEWLSVGIFLAVAFMWLVPDRRIESVLGD